MRWEKESFAIIVMVGCLMPLISDIQPLRAQDSSESTQVEGRGIPRAPLRPSVITPAPSPSGQVMSAYRAVLNQPAVRSRTDAEIRRQLRTIPPIAFVNGYWITPVDISIVYSQPVVRTALAGSLRTTPGGLQSLNTLVVGRTDVALVFTPNQLADIFQIPRADVMRMIGLDALRAKALDSYLNPQPGGTNVFAVWGYVKGAFNWMAAWWQNHKNEKQQKQTRDNCQDKGPSGDCDDDGVPNGEDACPYDPDCKHEKGSFVGCMIITCQTFTTELSGEFEGIIQQIATQIRQAGQAGQILPLGPVVAGQPAVGVVFPPGIR
jgi:hypothetical protein